MPDLTGLNICAEECGHYSCTVQRRGAEMAEVINAQTNAKAAGETLSQRVLASLQDYTPTDDEGDTAA